MSLLDANIAATPVNRSRWSGTVWSLSASLVVHLVLLALALLIRFQPPISPVETSLDATTGPLENPATASVLDLGPLPPTREQDLSDNPGGSSLAGNLDPDQIVPLEELIPVNEPLPTSPTSRAIVMENVATPIPRTAKLTIASTEKSSKKTEGRNREPGKPGRGQGQGVGDGIGDGKGFFGSPPKGKRLVFVVDNSNSMNMAHDSDAKTRFRRVKIELIKFIAELPPESEFFVLFFCDTTLTMPAQGLQPASLAAKNHYLKWVAQVETGLGPTDPRQAMSLALKMQPDMIFFLTDGLFRKGIAMKLESIKQSQTIINTFAIGEDTGAETLTTISRNNGGEYKLVP